MGIPVDRRFAAFTMWAIVAVFLASSIPDLTSSGGPAFRVLCNFLHAPVYAGLTVLWLATFKARTPLSGRMFALVDSLGNPFTSDYVKERARWEVLLEVVQTKGQSESAPFLSPTDEFANFELWDKMNLAGTKRHEGKAAHFLVIVLPKAPSLPAAVAAAPRRGRARAGSPRCS